jgi:hypothetical protein
MNQMIQQDLKNIAIVKFDGDEETRISILRP